MVKLSARVRRSIKRLRHSSFGGATVEMAIATPVLLLIAVGVMDFGRVFYTSITVANAARAGAEYGASQGAVTGSDFAGMAAYAQVDGDEAGTLTLNARRFCECVGAPNACSACTGNTAPEVYVEVTASKTVPMIINYPGLASNVVITRKATFRYQ